MRRTLCTISLVVLLGSGGALTAQSTSQPRPESTPPPTEEIKLSGCLKEAPPSSDSGTDANTGKRFVLEVMAPHAGMPSANRNPGTTRPETPDQTTRAGEKETYALMAMGNVDLAKHVNHMVELTGTKAKMPAPASSPTAPSGSSSTASTGDHPMFHVTALRMISTSCKPTSQQ
jgi:hypothetical protein